jgi:hypothetical protein
MSWETAWTEAAVARRFVQRLAALPPGDRRPALAPVLDRDPYLSAWSNVQAALGQAPEESRVRTRQLLAELDAELERLDMLPSLREAARRAVRALLARRWLITAESLASCTSPRERDTAEFLGSESRAGALRSDPADRPAELQVRMRRVADGRALRWGTSRSVHLTVRSVHTGAFHATPSMRFSRCRRVRLRPRGGGHPARPAARPPELASPTKSSSSRRSVER